MPLSVIKSNSLDVPTSPSPSSAGGASNGKTQTVFIHKLYDMLHDQTIAHLIWWSPTKDSFCLLPGEDFSKVLAQYFKHTNIASFIRQLNMYGFHKVNDTFQNNNNNNNTNTNASVSNPDLNPGSSSSSTRWEFRHSTNQFRKGDIDSLKLIKRRSSKNINSHKEVVNLKSIPTSNPDPEYFGQPLVHPVPISNTPPLHIQDAALHKSGSASSIPMVAQPMYMAGPGAYISDDEAPSRLGSLDNLHQQYHQSLQIQQQSLLNKSASSNSPGPGNVSRNPSIQQAPELIPVPPPLVTNPSFENSVNFKFVELNNQINILKNEANVANSRYESVYHELKRNQADTLLIIEMLQHFLESNVPTTIKQEGLDKPNINTNIFNAVPDRTNNKTPVNKIDAMLDDTNTSPMSGHHKNQAPPPPATTLQQELQKFKSSIQLRINNFLQVVQPPQQQQQPTLAAPYHLNEHYATANSRNPSSHNIVPQHYPLNPHYVIYRDHNEVPFRNVKLAAGGKEDGQGQPQQGRHLSVLMDPLQPMPLRQGSRVLGDDANAAAMATHNANIQLRNKSKSYSPLTIGGPNQQQPPGPSYLQSSSQINTVQSSPSQSSSGQSQYPFPESGGPQNLPPINGRLYSTGARTNSLPNPSIEHSGTTAGGSDQKIVGPTSNFYQRNSFTSMYDQQHQTQSPHRFPVPQGSYNGQAFTSVPPTHYSAMAMPKNVPSINGVRAGSPLDDKSKPSTPLPRSEEEIPTSAKKPSVSELDKSLKGHGNVLSLLNKEDELAMEHGQFKKRKV